MSLYLADRDIGEIMQSNPVLNHVQEALPSPPLPLLLKTFSKNPFQGQYPTNAVSINETPAMMHRSFQKPDRKKANGMRMTPRTIRPVFSTPATFLAMPMDTS
jgi:hypothetical protein